MTWICLKKFLLPIHPQNFHNNFITNFMWQAVIGSNLDSPLKLLFCPQVIASNNLSLRICCENIMDVLSLSLSLSKKL